MKKRKATLSQLAVLAFAGLAMCAQAATLVQFRAANAGLAGSYVQVASDYSDGHTRRWDYSITDPLFSGTIPIYGGVNVVNSGTMESASFLRLHDNNPAGWPNVPELFLQSIADGSGTTTNNVNMCYLWKRENFSGVTPTDVVTFDAASTLSVNITSWAQVTGGNPTQIRFLVMDGSNYYVSEAAFTSTSGSLTLSNFVGNSATGKRWAPVLLTGTSFDIPGTLAFAPQLFGDVRAVGWIGRGSRKYSGLFASDSFDAAGTVNYSTMSMSENLDDINDYTPSCLFVDVFKKTRSWMTRNADGSGAWDTALGQYIPADTNGWPTSVPFTTGTYASQMVHTINFVTVPGSYRMRFLGSGTFKLKHTGTNGNILTETFDPARIATLPVDTDGKRYFDTQLVGSIPDVSGMFNEGTIYLEIYSSTGSTYLRGFEFILPGYAGTTYAANPFNPAYASMVWGFRSLRMMNWGSTNYSNPLQTWSDRTKPTTFTQGRNVGCCLEYMAKFCNDTGKNLWLCIPHLADETYIRKAARVLRYGSKADGEPFDPLVDPPAAKVWSGLDPSHKLYIEYSNETWNTASAFAPQRNYCISSGTTLRAQGLPFDANDTYAGHQYAAYRSAQIWQWFYEEWGTEAQARIVRVLASQSAGTTVSTTRLGAFTIPGLITVDQYPDALAIAPYFGGPVADQIVTNGEVDTITVPDILARARTHMETSVTQEVINQKAIADQYGVFLNLYESGQHIVATGSNVNNTALTSKLVAANRDPGMGPIYTDYVAMLSSHGVAEMFSFTHISTASQWGSFGLFEWLGQPESTAYKYLPLKAWMQANPAPNRAPLIELDYPSSVVDSNGNGTEPVTLSAAKSFDYDGTVNAITWNISGTSVLSGTAVTPVFSVGDHPVTVQIADNQGVSNTASFNVLVRPQGSDTVLVQSNFVGTTPGMNKPWTSTSTLNSGVLMGGWTYTVTSGSIKVAAGAPTNNAFAVYLTAGYARATLDQAVTAGQYLSCTVTPVNGKTLDLRGAKIDFAISSVDMNSARGCALMTNISGFTSGAAVFNTGIFTTGSPTTPANYGYSAFLPTTSAYENVTGPIEFRIYFYDNIYASKEIRLTAFRFEGAVH